MFELRDSTVLVTGGAGTVGSHIVDALIAENVRKIIVFDNFASGKMNNLREAMSRKEIQMEVVSADVRSRDDLDESLQGVDYVFHEASVLLLESMKKPQKAIDVNIQGTFNVFQSALKAGVKKIVWASSASVFGEPVRLPVDEDHPFNNKTFYGATKAACEMIATSLNFTSGLKHVGLRYYNIFGPRQGIRGAYAQIIPRWCERIEKNEPIVIFADGSQSMDLIYVKDIARANICALKSDCVNDFFNIGTGVETTVKQLAHHLLEITGCKLPPVYEPHDVNLVKRRQCSTRLAREKIGFSAQTSIREGLAEYWQWRQHEFTH
ncbi:MAG: SDR family NAD(P)-dependent oxidoreductase [Verrucomicrobiae bacterium]|nr:SDR family NAD(P)-dependent oxidoreductase [Verrucomicrobiae bacterium]